jgi:hypothetical protein
MFAAEEELVRVLTLAGVGRWVTDEYGRNMLLEDFAEYFVKELAGEIACDAANNDSKLDELRWLLDEKPRKSISVSKIREVIDA